MKLSDQIEIILTEEKVSSSMINSVDYNPSTEELEVEFNNGSVYRYYDVPSEVHEKLMSAASHGKFFWTNIRNDYSYDKIS